jgi:ribosomal protein L44E
VVKACADGGIKKAKGVMKGMQKKGKTAGLKFECDECHKDESASNWTLKDGAEDKFKKLLAAQK